MKIEAVLVTFGVLSLGACSVLHQPVSIESSAESPVSQRRTIVRDQVEFQSAVKKALPGDEIVLADGVWMDFDAVFQAKGTSAAPILLTSETPGGVVLSGRSSLRLAGKHLIVSGLVFRDGYTSRNEVISFRVDSDHLANNTRVTNTVIENYSNPDRTQRDMWVVMYGKNNEFDHNHLEGKLNSGPTMAVRLDSKESQENGHHVHHNYFGPRPVLGSNGGETFRIGTSHFSLTNSNTLVESNYFDRCSGEVEIVSNKSGGNTFRSNTFFESRGTLTLRHGNGNRIENNLFDGNGAPFTGGVRVINAHQTIKGNYFKNLTGKSFSGGLVLMNGVPNSPINRYHQVDGAVIEDNVFENVGSIELGAGSDAERSATPSNSTFSNNTIFDEQGKSPFNIYDDVSGIAFSSNKSNAVPPAALSSGIEVDSTLTQKVDVENVYGVAKEDTGVTWYPKSKNGSPFGTGKTIIVYPGENAISTAIQDAHAGDQLLLEAGEYNESKIVELDIPITITGADGKDGVSSLSFERQSMFVLSADAGLKLENVNVSGAKAPDNVGNNFITTSAMGGSNHVVEISNSTFSDFVVNRSFSIIGASKGTLYQKLKITNSIFENISGSVVKLNAEADDYGMYNVEFLEIENSQFNNVAGSAISVYRGGTDESTFGPNVSVKDSYFKNVGKADYPTMWLHGVQNLTLEGNTLENSKPFRFIITTGKPIPVISGNTVLGNAEQSALVEEAFGK